MPKKIAKKEGGISMVFLLGVISLVIFSSSSAKVQAAVSYPAQILDLSNWKVTLPTGKSGSPTEFVQPALETCNVNPYFHANANADGVVFRAPVNGVTTSGSSYPRAELREMKNDGQDKASWSTTSGTHTMFIDGAITAVPKTKKHIVFGQVHDSDDDVVVVRLEYPKLFVDINGKTGPTLDANYVLGKRFTVKFVAENGQIKLFYNGSQKPVYTLKKSTSGCYFKAGAYTQSNCSKEKDCSSNNFGEVVIYKLALNGETVIPVNPPATDPIVESVTPSMPEPELAPVGGLTFEAESGAVTAPMQIMTSPTASGEKYAAQTSDSGVGSVKYAIDIEKAGKYQLRSRVISPNGSSNSVYFSFDGGSFQAWNLPDTLQDWTWVDGALIELTQGRHVLEIKKREKNTQLDMFELKRSETMTVESTTETTVPFEAESGVVSGGMRVVDDPLASGQKYVQADSSGKVIYQLDIPVAGKYRLAGWIKALTGSSDSFYVSLDGKASVIWTLGRTADWAFDLDDRHTFSLSAGRHSLTIKYREAGAKIDRGFLIKQ